MPFSLFNHPILFAAVAVAAIGVVIFEFVSSQNKPHGGPSNRPRRGGGPPDSPRRGGGPPDSPRLGEKPPDRPGNGGNRPGLGKPPLPPNHAKDNKLPSPSNSPKQVTSTDSKPSRERETSNDSKVVQHSNSPVNNLRKRIINNSETSVKVSSTITVTQQNETSTTGRQNNQDDKFDESNYCRNVLDKLTNDTKNVNLTNENISGHNINEEESDSSDNNLFMKGEEKLINQIKIDENVTKSKHRRKFKKSMKKSTSNDSDQDETLSSSDDSKTYSNPQKRPKIKHFGHHHKHNLHESKNATDHDSILQVANFDPLLNVGSDSSSLDEDINKKGSDSVTLDKSIYLKEVHEALKSDVSDKKENNPDSSSVCLSENIEVEMPSEHNFCKACEERHINTRAYPCNHAYLCVDCAVRIFRVCKTCSICLADVVEFVS